jgi:malate dehydrogenase
MAKQLSCRPEDITQFIIWGNHSNTQFADFTHTYVKGECSFGVIDRQGQTHDWYREGLVTETQQRGAAVLKARGLSSGFSTAEAIKDHLKDLFLGNEKAYVSAGIIIKDIHEKVENEEELCCSVPILCTGNFKFELKTEGMKMDYNPKALELIQKSLQELREEKAEAFATQ